MSRIAVLEAQVATTSEDAIVSLSAAPVAGFNTTVSLLAGAGAWAPGISMPEPRSDLQAVRCGTHIFVLGGLNLSNVVVPTVWAFDPIHETYDTFKTPMPTPRYRFGAACLDGKIYAAGGFDTSEAGMVGTSLASVDVYDVSTDTWVAG